MLAPTESDVMEVESFFFLGSYLDRGGGVERASVLEWLQHGLNCAIFLASSVIGGFPDEQRQHLRLLHPLCYSIRGRVVATYSAIDGYYVTRGGHAFISSSYELFDKQKQKTSTNCERLS